MADVGQPAATAFLTPDLGVDPQAVLRDVVFGRLATAAAAATAVARDLPVEQVETTGSPVSVLQAESTRAELVVLGDRGLGGFAGLLIGSVAVALAAHAACPVAVVQGAPGITGEQGG